MYHHMGRVYIERVELGLWRPMLVCRLLTACQTVAQCLSNICPFSTIFRSKRKKLLISASQSQKVVINPICRLDLTVTFFPEPDNCFKIIFGSSLFTLLTTIIYGQYLWQKIKDYTFHGP